MNEVTSQLMTDQHALLCPVVVLPFVALHGASTPVPHWLVLIVAVLGLWIIIGGGVMIGDGIIEWIGWMK